ncbi:hypothetical protein PAP_06330 [Palaeococcus pacificus DY20341]|uniref:6-hydroxymethyl-7,8-dihydropterin pyrophosphokinase n=1 Tax=Palaeococcus pacificus DY20341 TaxID=1343739 RepID=A0A075LYL1_9EURY|nr:6-hydroxymethylpterin diphosphokinase MptE-like protein [Palaeococcus pacificus]AIF69663.1 hypothetical protein PAP_06330 [Palaeococcus pacificus DY20341]
MEWEEWKPFYDEIVREMGFDEKADRKASLILRDILLKSENYTTISELRKLIRERAYVFGAGPSLEESLKTHTFDDGILIAADGATSALLEHNILPHIIVTDLDGRFEDIKKANELGSFVVVHAHGDNIEKLKAYASKLKNVLGTCQTEPLDIIYNFGGFTDGDRGAFLAEALGTREACLVGFDFGEIVGKWSKPHLKEHSPIWESKRKKFYFAQKLLKWLEENGKARITYL